MSDNERETIAGDARRAAATRRAASWRGSAPRGGRRCCARWRRRCASRTRARRSSPPTPRICARAKAEDVARRWSSAWASTPPSSTACATGCDQLAAMPDLVGRATLRRELDDGLVLERVTCAARPAGRRLRVAPRRARADRRPRLEERQRRAAQGRPRGARARTARSPRSIHRVLEARGIDPRAAVLLEGREDVAARAGPARHRRGDRRARLVGVRAPHPAEQATSP